MAQAEDPFPAVIKSPEQEHEARDKKGHVGGRDDNLRATTLRLAPQIIHELLGVMQMLHQVHQQNLVIARHIIRNGRA